MSIRLVLHFALLLKVTSMPATDNLEYTRQFERLKLSDDAYRRRLLDGGFRATPITAHDYEDTVEDAQYLDGEDPILDRGLELLMDNSKPSSKRGWDNLPLAWRGRAPKRALAVVNRLWKLPGIRKKYMQYLKNGKRSKEYIEHIPVQSENNADPTWMIDEVGYYADAYPDTLEGPINVDYDNRKAMAKRGWEMIRPLGNGRKRLAAQSRAYRTQGSSTQRGKRAWEPIVFKQRNDGRSKRTLYDIIGFPEGSGMHSNLNNDINSILTKLDILRNSNKYSNVRTD